MSFNNLLSYIRKKTPRPIAVLIGLLAVLFLGLGIGYTTNHVLSENAKFERFSENIFRNEVASNTLNLHYALASPEKQGISRPKASLGTIPTDMEPTYTLCQTYEERLKSFDYARLNKDNQLTLDTLLLYFHTQRSLGEQFLLEEFISPSLGIQAQLPVLLAEYAFYQEQDITDYLNLLACVKPYFQSILAFEKEKSAAGFFMSDTTLDRVLKQCSAFIEEPDSNYMLEIFDQKLKDFGKLSSEDQKRLSKEHRTLLTAEVIPAYRELMDGLNALRGTGTNTQGLAHFRGGKEYYQYLLQSKVGSFFPIRKMEQRLTHQLMTDFKEIGMMLKEQPSLLTKYSQGTDLPSMKPAEILKLLEEKMNADFPETEAIPYEVRYVHESMEDYLSPAFYLTPPMDTQSPNVIYINQANRSKNLELFTTLAHEGFPGHMYQTVYFARSSPAGVRSLFDSPGYIEGWATYVESYAYQYAADSLKDEAAQDFTRFAWLNRSVNLCIYSLLDIGIHYHGWSLTNATAFLQTLGIKDEAVIQEIYQYIVETPANYLKYYWGYLNFLDLKKMAQKRLEDDFDLKKFHQSVLEIGPVQFPILEKYILYFMGTI